MLRAAMARWDHVPTISPSHGGGGRLPDARMIGRMSEAIFVPGANVFTPRGSGSVVDVRATPSCKFVSGGEVRYFGEGAPARTELIAA